MIRVHSVCVGEIASADEKTQLVFLVNCNRSLKKEIIPMIKYLMLIIMMIINTDYDHNNKIIMIR